MKFVYTTVSMLAKRAIKLASEFTSSWWSQIGTFYTKRKLMTKKGGQNWSKW